MQRIGIKNRCMDSAVTNIYFAMIALVKLLMNSNSSHTIHEKGISKLTLLGFRVHCGILKQ